MLKPLGAAPEAWAHFAVKLGLGAHLLPAVPDPQAPIAPGSTISPGMLGKIPSRYREDGMVTGIPWTTLVVTVALLRLWSAGRLYNLCVRGTGACAFDLDVESEEEALALVKAIWEVTGVRLPVRSRPGSFRVLLPFRLEPGAVLEHEAHAVKSGRVELLGTHQQWVACGHHGKSGTQYQWDGREGGLPEAIPVLSLDQVQLAWLALGGGRLKVPRAERKAVEVPAGDDPVVAHLLRRGVVREEPREGRWPLVCPWVKSHTMDGGLWEAVWHEAGSGGFRHGHFHCFHAACETRSDDEFLAAVEYAQPLSVMFEFDPGAPPPLADASDHNRKPETAAPPGEYGGSGGGAGGDGSTEGLLKRVSEEDLMRVAPPERLALPGIPMQAYSLVAGALASYKSTALDYWLLWKATGVDLMRLGGGAPVEPGVAVRLTYEDTHQRIVERMGRLVQGAHRELAAGAGPEAASRFLHMAAEHLRFVPLSGLEGRGLTLKAQGVVGRNTPWLEALAAAIRREAPRGCLVGLDPLRLAMEGSQNDDEGADVVVRTLNWLSCELGPDAALLAASHTTKAQAIEPGSGYASAAYATSGSGLLSQHARSNFFMTRLTAQEIRKLFPWLPEGVAERQQVVRITHGRLSFGQESEVAYLWMCHGTLTPISPRERQDAGTLTTEGAIDVIAALELAAKTWPQVSGDMLIGDERLRAKYSRDQLRGVIKTLIVNGVLKQEGKGRAAHLVVGAEAARFRENLAEPNTRGPF
jgi:hypothetical protein